MAYARALLKLSGEALMGDQGYGIDPAIVQSIATDVAGVIAGGTQLAIVVGGGLAGVSAANPILEHGGNVILLDKSAATSALRTSNRLQTL